MSPDLKSQAASTTTLETAWAVPYAANMRHASGVTDPSYRRSTGLPAPVILSRNASLSYRL